jgi:predicted AlkP superfamily pyrophosphatase or phosphodiesterase
VAAERQGVSTAALGWYGAHSGTRGALASVVGEDRFADYPEDPGRADQVVAQLTRTDADRPRLVLAYFKGPDWSQHRTGIDSEETRAEVTQMDGLVGRVMAAIEASGRPTALLVTTDHGMREVSHIANVRRILHWHGIEAEPVSTGTTSFLYFADGAEVDAAHSALAGYEQFEVLRGDALPEYARLGNGGRVPQLIISAKHPYFIEDTDLWPSWLRWMGRWGPRFVWARPFLKATHGFPPDVEGMSGVLYAWGDGVAKGREVEHVRSVDVHPTAARLLGIAPGRPVDGRVVEGFLVGAGAP